MFFDAIDRVRGWIGAWQFSLPPASQFVKAGLFALVLAAWYGLMLGSGTTNHGSPTVGEESFVVATSSAAYGLAARLENHRWRLVRCDESPAANGDVTGYMAVYEHPWWDSGPADDSCTPALRHTYRELFFIPADQPGALESDRSIRWLRVADEPPDWIKAEGKRVSAYLGTAGGFAVYGKMTLAQLEMAHRTLETSGDAGLLAMLEARLPKCETDSAYLSTVRLIASDGAGAVPALKRAIDDCCASRRFSVVSLLAQIPGSESADLLHELYRRPDTRIDVHRALNIIRMRSDRESIVPSYAFGERGPDA